MINRTQKRQAARLERLSRAFDRLHNELGTRELRERHRSERACRLHASISAAVHAITNEGRTR